MSGLDWLRGVVVGDETAFYRNPVDLCGSLGRSRLVATRHGLSVRGLALFGYGVFRYIQARRIALTESQTNPRALTGRKRKPLICRDLYFYNRPEIRRFAADIPKGSARSR